MECQTGILNLMHQNRALDFFSAPIPLFLQCPISVNGNSIQFISSTPKSWSCLQLLSLTPLKPQQIFTFDPDSDSFSLSQFSPRLLLPSLCDSILPPFQSCPTHFSSYDRSCHLLSSDPPVASHLAQLKSQSPYASRLEDPPDLNSCLSGSSPSCFPFIYLFRWRHLRCIPQTPHCPRSPTSDLCTCFFLGLGCFSQILRWLTAYFLLCLLKVRADHAKIALSPPYPCAFFPLSLYL